MTASLPVPREPLPDEPDESVARTGDGEIVEFAKGARNAAADAAARPASPRPKRPAKPRAPRKRTPKVAPDPGPPPPLPPGFGDAVDDARQPDLVIESVIDDVEIVVPPKPELPAESTGDAEIVVPPKPEVPAEVAAAAVVAEVVQPDVVVPPKPALPADVIVEVEVEVEVEAEPVEPEVVEPESAAAVVEPEVIEPEAVEPEVAEPEVVEPAVVEAETIAPEIDEPEIIETESAAADVEEIDAAIETDLLEAEEALDAVLPTEDTQPDEVLPVETIEPDTEVDALDELLEAAAVDATVVETVETDEIEDDDLETATDDVDEFAALTSVFPGAGEAAAVDEDTAALVLRGVSKHFGDTRAVEGIDLTVPAGSFYGLVGPNGAGKTTTLSMIAGLLSPDRGVVRVGGIDAASDPLGAKRVLGVLPDRLRTFDRLTGRQLLYYYGVLRGLSSSVVASRTADLARAFDLTDALGRVVSDYSAGMIKKVMLAGAMIHSPRVLVLDEPFEAVDPVSSAVILDILSAYVAHGGTVILSSHGMDLVERVCTRVAVIVAGQVLAEGTIEEVRGELTLEQRFIELAGGLSDVEGLEWLHTFSD